MLPSIGSNVWIEFEEGNPDYPIWAGCFWDENGAPKQASSPAVRTLVAGGAELTLDSTAGGGSITLKVGPPTVNIPCELRCSASGIELKIGASSIKLDSSRVVVNEGALEIK